MDNTEKYALVHHPDCIPERDTEDYSEWFEDAASEADWIANFDIHGLDSSTACSLADSVRSMTLMDELYEKNKVLETEWRESEQKYQNLKVENQKLTIQLSNERHRANKYQKKLQYIQDNHEIFNRLKQAYLNMRYNEATGRTMKEINEIAVQTWEGVLCEACIETAESKRRSNLESANALEQDEMVAVKKDDLSKLQSTVLALKTKIEQREKSWSFNADRENKYKATISDLQANIQLLQSIVAEKCGELPLVKSDSTPQMMRKENEFLKKIIIKLEKRHRDLVKTYKAQKNPAFLNDHEKFMIQQLIGKYSKKLKQKPTRYLMVEGNRSLSVSTSVTPRPSTSPKSPRSSRSKLSRIRPSSASPISSISGEGEPFTFTMPALTIDTELTIEQAEKPLSPRKSNFSTQNIIPLH